MKSRVFITFFLLLTFSRLYSQDPARFAEEIKAIGLKYKEITPSADLIVFTGSSSLRRWDNLQEYFPSKNIINTAFGGSQMSDLLFYADSVILKYKPAQVFIYEGDNDLASDEMPGEIVKEAKMLCKRIHKELPGTEIVIISAKPSPIRWNLKDQYLSLNRLYSKLGTRYKYIQYVDLWSPLTGPSGRPRGELFIKDSLHINNDGYRIWAGEIEKILK